MVGCFYSRSYRASNIGVVFKKTNAPDESRKIKGRKKEEKGRITPLNEVDAFYFRRLSATTTMMTMMISTMMPIRR